MFVKLPEDDWCVYFNDSLVEDVYSADDVDNIVLLYEHDRTGNRVPWYDASLKHEEWALLSLKGNVEIKRSSTVETREASDWFKKSKIVINSSLGLGVECTVDIEVSFIMTGSVDGVPHFRIPQFGSKYKDCDWTITGLREQSLNHVCISVTRLEGDLVKQCGNGEVVEVDLKMMGPAVLFEMNSFSNSLQSIEYNYENRLVNMKLLPGYGTRAAFVDTVKKFSRLGP